jgi:hypothetical protein
VTLASLRWHNRKILSLLKSHTPSGNHHGRRCMVVQGVHFLVLQFTQNRSESRIDLDQFHPTPGGTGFNRLKNFAIQEIGLHPAELATSLFLATEIKLLHDQLLTLGHRFVNYLFGQ